MLVRPTDSSSQQGATIFTSQRRSSAEMQKFTFCCNWNCLPCQTCYTFDVLILKNVWSNLNLGVSWRLFPATWYATWLKMCNSFSVFHIDFECSFFDVFCYCCDADDFCGKLVTRYWTEYFTPVFFLRVKWTLVFNVLCILLSYSQYFANGYDYGL